MSDIDHKAILERAIQMSIDNGWQPPFEEPLQGFTISTDKINDTHQLEPYVLFELDGETDWATGIPNLIYNHEFAKALCGDEPIKEYFGMSCTVTSPAFAFHLQQMVISPGPIKYLGDNL